MLLFSKWNYGTEGRGFESLQPHHLETPYRTEHLRSNGSFCSPSKVFFDTYLNTYVDEPRLTWPYLFARVSESKSRHGSTFIWRHTVNPSHTCGVLRRKFCGCSLPASFAISISSQLRIMTNKLGTTKMLYSVAEAAILLSLSRGSVYKLIASGRLLAVYPTSQARISADALHRYVALLEKEQREGSLQLSRALA